MPAPMPALVRIAALFAFVVASAGLALAADNPLIGTWLLRAYDRWEPIAFYILGAGAISLLSALVMRETRGVSLLAIDQADREATA